VGVCRPRAFGSPPTSKQIDRLPNEIFHFFGGVNEIQGQWKKQEYICETHLVQY
jgi:hypothetical protein